MAFFEAFASLRLQKRPFGARKILCSVVKKSITIFSPFLERKILLICLTGKSDIISQHHFNVQNAMLWFVFRAVNKFSNRCKLYWENIIRSGNHKTWG